MVLIFLRRPDALLNAQFWAEDGPGWFAVAYNSHYSLSTIFQPYSGYVLIFPRIVAIITGQFGINHTPFIFNSFAILVQALPVVYILSKRFRTVVPSKLIQILLALIYLLLPYTSEINANITNSMWHLAITGFFLVLLPHSKVKLVNYLEYLLLIFVCLSGPFGIFLLIIYILRQGKKVRPKNLLTPQFLILLAGTITQITSILLTSSTRTGGEIGVSIHQLSIILSGQVFGSGLFGDGSMRLFVANLWAIYGFALLLCIILSYGVWKGPLFLKMFIVYAGLVFVSCLFSANNGLPHHTWWESLSFPKTGGRYFYLMHLSLFATIVWLIFSKRIPRMFRIFAALLFLSAVCIGILSDFEHPAYIDFHYQEFAQRYYAAQPGEIVQTQLNPGLFWVVGIRKH